MSSSMTPKYRIECRDQQGWHRMAWDGRGLGKPDDAKAEAWRQAMNQSYQPRGINWHVSQALGVVPHVNLVQVVVQTGVRAGHVVARAAMPMFEVV